MTKRISKRLKVAWIFDDAFHAMSFPDRHGLRRTVSQASTGMLTPRMRWILIRRDQLRFINPSMNSPVR